MGLFTNKVGFRKVSAFNRGEQFSFCWPFNFQKFILCEKVWCEPEKVLIQILLDQRDLVKYQSFGNAKMQTERENIFVILSRSGKEPPSLLEQ